MPPWLLWIPSALAAILVDAAEAARLVDDPATVVLDARDLPSYLAGHVPGAVRTDWRIGTDRPASGKVRDPAALAAHYASLGVRADAPVLVVGAWTHGSGEDGRVAWNLVWLGHPDVHVLRGGMAAWRKGTEVLPPPRPEPGTFTANAVQGVRVDARSLRNDPDAWTIVDVRTPEEFAGVADTEADGGHLPGATNIPWTTLLAAPPTLPTDKTVVVYCSSGLRSALAWVALTDAGYRAVNYDGSWWEWASLYER